jgi:cellulose synthase/poly-beta-1,6-N-acetylglucosamine synthase-like glycosyltransferase
LVLHFDLEWFVQSSPLLTHMGWPKGWHYIFTKKLLFEESEVCLYFFSGWWVDALLHPQKKLGKHPYLINKSNNRRAKWANQNGPLENKYYCSFQFQC